MDFGNYIFEEYKKNLDIFPEFTLVTNEIDGIFFALFGTVPKSRDMQHDMLLRLISSVRRNYLLSVFLFQTSQSSSGIQTMRTMIESGEFILSCLIDWEKFWNLIGEDIESDKNSIDKIRNQILNKWINNTQNESIKSTRDTFVKLKNRLNASLAHANPFHNLATGSGNVDFNFILKDNLLLDGYNPMGFPQNFLYVSNSMLSLFLLIYQIALELDYKNLEIKDNARFITLNLRLTELTRLYYS